MTNEKATANYKYDRAIDLIRRIKTEETHERCIDRRKAFDLAINALEKQIPKKPVGGVKAAGICPNCGERFLMYQIGMRDFPTPHAFLFDYCLLCGQRIDWS